MSTTDTVKRLPKRSEVDPAHTWDLAPLYATDEAWKAEFSTWEQRIGEYAAYQGTLGQSAARLAEFFTFDLELDRSADRLGTYAFLRMAEDVTNTAYQEATSRIRNASSRAAQAASFVRPEIMAIPDEAMQQYLADPVLAPYKLLLERILRYKPHTLSQNEERLLAMGSEVASTASIVFGQLNDSELKFGEVDAGDGERVELSHATFSALLHSPNRAVRQATFHQYYGVYSGFKNTIAATLNGSIQRDLYAARARNFPSSLEAALFDDKMPTTVYDSLISAVHEHLPHLHRYYEVRRQAMQLEAIHMYDTYVPILSDLEQRHTWDEAVEKVIAAIAPLGPEYCEVLAKGLRGRWCDRYENKGKRSGAFSSGCFDSEPYILMNYREEVLDHVFTLAHEAGHSMHTYYSKTYQPYQYHSYGIFVAEVASTFNEQLLSQYLQSQATTNREKAFLVNRELDAIRGTLFRQTMFAEFEKITHALAEAHEPLTCERFQSEYHKLLERYFGPEFVLDAELDLECFRIPHFYRAFYVYKYATGISAAIALVDRVTNGGPAELNDYLGFLKGGCSKYPLDLLRGAGVDLETPSPVRTALARFGTLVSELERLLQS